MLRPSFPTKATVYVVFRVFAASLRLLVVRLIAHLPLLSYSCISLSLTHTHTLILQSGDWMHNITMYDYLRVPDHLTPGDYVLGFRWDCESSAQVWQSCADVKITASSSAESEETN